MSAAILQYQPTAQPMPHARIPNVLLRSQSLNATGIALYAMLASYAGAKGVCYPSLQRLADDLGVSSRTIRRTLRILEDVGVIVTETTPGRQSHYRLVDDWTPDTGVRGTPDKNDGGTPDKSDTPDMSVRTTPDKNDTDPGHQCPPKKYKEEVQGEEGRERGAHPRDGDAESLPRGVSRRPDGKGYQLEPIATDPEGKSVFATDALLFVGKHAADIHTTDYDVPLKAWVETHGHTLPKPHDLKRIVRDCEKHGNAAVTAAIRQAGDRGILSLEKTRKLIGRVPA